MSQDPAIAAASTHKDIVAATVLQFGNHISHSLNTTVSLTCGGDKNMFYSQMSA